MGKESRKSKFNGVSYRDAQRANSSNRLSLEVEDQKWLKNNGYKNVGWDNVINLHYKIEEFLDNYKLDEFTLEELFLEANRVGEKYQTSQEIEEFNQKLAQEVESFLEEVDKQFPDTEDEIVDFSTKTSRKTKKAKNSKSYRTVKT